MSTRNKLIGGFAMLLFLIAGIYFFFPSDTPSEASKEKEIKVSFLEVDAHWADSLLNTLSTEEKAAMLIMYKPKPALQIDSIPIKTQNYKPGGYLFAAPHICNYPDKVDISQSLLFTTYFQVPVIEKMRFETPEVNENTILGSPELFFSVKDDSLLKESKSLLIKAIDHHHIDGIILPVINSPGNPAFENKVFQINDEQFLNRLFSYSKILNEENVLSATGSIDYFYDLTRDTTVSRQQVIEPYAKLAEKNIPVMMVDSAIQPEKLKENSITNYLKENFKFRGLIFSNVKSGLAGDQNAILKLLMGGSDLIITDNFALLHLNLVTLIKGNKLSENLINAKIKKILLAKTWSGLKKKRIGYEYKEKFNIYEQSFPRRFRKGAITLLKNDRSFVPITNVTNNKVSVIHLGHHPNNFLRQIYKYLPEKQVVPAKVIKNVKDFSSLTTANYKNFNTVIVTINIPVKDDKLIIEKLDALSSSGKLLLVNYNHPENIESLKKYPTLLQVWGNTMIENEFSAQALFGALKMNAVFPLTTDKKITGLKFDQCRLQYTIPEDIGISSDSLFKIDYIVKEGIRNRAFPAAQVFFAIDGKAFYNKSFGTPTYTERSEVKTTDLFDMASVTKVAASTIIAMDTYEKGYYQLNDSLYRYIPDTLKKHIYGKSSLRNITFRQILIHATGLAAGQPIIRYIRYRDSLIDKKGRFDKYYCDYSDDYYKIKVAEDFYMEREQEDTIWYAMNRMSVDENPSYRYSDANMNLLFKLLNPRIKYRWKYFLDSLYYKPLGMFNSFYTPLDFGVEPERIIPTENDRYWRKQLLRGYVHDPTAALFGGVAGNAGLFSTAQDIGILFQMLMYKGSYGGRQYLKKETVELFISKQPDSHRGLGFNRQVKGNTYGVSPYASKNTFGHTGFTGISVWADMDINLLYVSCTNRVHPDAENKKIIQLGTTKRIHNVIYEQLFYIMPDKISLEKW